MSQSNKILLQELFIFVILAVISLVTAWRLQILLRSLPPEVLIVQPQVSSLSQAGGFVIYFLVATVLMLTLLKVFKKSRIPFELLFSGGMWAGMVVLFSLLVGDLWSLVIATFLIFLRWFYLRVWTHNVVLILGLAGVTAVLGLQISALTIVMILVFLAVYDFVAVYKTKHMVWMAKELIKRKVIFAVIIPEKVKDYVASLNKVKPRQGFIIMGSGDLALPMLLAVSVFAGGLANSLIVVTGILLGVVMTHYIFQKTKKPIPALPPIGMGAVLGWLLQLMI